MLPPEESTEHVSLSRGFDGGYKVLGGMLGVAAQCFFCLFCLRKPVLSQAVHAPELLVNRVN